ncbi:glutathione S-transferase theta-3-like [Drosophila sulfurigaster albostrigata]|uniref:glutathione S-transferase theta-3-like n=1 Tax=Drosophila sulfurigaster albostrigata TaxID=89887 RepID=UPI002D2196D9|nr:glutathione S-transferase theta-3-like [Drosophila sulfurigaster albostrigata]
MASAMKYYYDLLSPPSRALWIALKLAKTPFEDCPVALRKQEQLSEEYKSINRFQKVPALVDGSFHLSESVAMVRYLADTKQLTEQLYPKSIQDRARMDEYLEWQHINLRLPCNLYFRDGWLFPINGITPKPKPEELESYITNVNNSLELLEHFWLDQNFLIGSHLTVADLFSSSDIEQLKLCQYTVDEQKFPKVAKWLDRVRDASQPYHDKAYAFLQRKSKATAQSKL